MKNLKHKKFILNISTISFLFSFAHAPLGAAAVLPTRKGQGQVAAQKKPTVDLGEFSHLDPKRMIADTAITRAMTYFKKNITQFANRTYMAIVDYTKPSNARRLFIVNLKTGAVEAHLVSHGKGSDPANTGFAQKFSNVENSDASSLGFYKTAEVYEGKHGPSLRLDGLSSTNSNARARAIVIHAAWYVNEDADHAGRSDGCIAVDEKERDDVINKLKDGALIYGWDGQS